MTWPFADLSWWVNETHRVTPSMLQYVAEFLELAAPSVSAAPDEWLAAYNGKYDELVRSISRCPSSRGNEFLMRDALFLARMVRKWRIASPATARRRRDEAIGGFISRNAAVALMDYRSGFRSLLSEVRRLLHYWLPTGSWEATGRFGPGACAEHWSHPRRLDRLVAWCDAGASWPDVPVGSADMDHICARLHAVPKDAHKDRLITIEPAYATFSQQWARALILESVHGGPLKGSAMDLAYVDGAVVQRRLAVMASRTRRLATVDLSDASDFIAWDLVQEVFPSWVCHLLDVTRTPTFTVVEPDSTVEQNSYSLSMFGGMGNACTFVIETLLFSAVVCALCSIHGLRPFVSTFGDDIICSNEAANLLEMYNLPFMHFGAAKSFYSEQDGLRESCGVFALNGIDISMPRIVGYADSWRGRCAVAELHQALTASGSALGRCLARSIAATHCLPNWPFRVDGFPSITDWSVEFDPLPQYRWNHDLQRGEVKLIVEEQKMGLLPAFPGRRDFARPAYLGYLTGMVRLVYRHGRGYAAFPDGNATTHKARWLRAYKPD